MKNNSIDDTVQFTEKVQMSESIVITKPVVVQLPISLYEGKLHVVETEMQLPADYQPTVGSFFVHDVLPGRLSVHWWGFDARNHKTYLCLSVGYSDSTRTIDEWLVEYSEWHVSKDPLVMLSSDEDDEVSDLGDDPY
tara:strand:- start:288 stop:698 length:411 start_codon:yes stop_codon:yes gene_type:complete